MSEPIPNPHNDPTVPEIEPSVDIPVRSSESIMTVEQFDAEYEKLETFLNEIERETGGDLRIYKKDFWPRFFQAIESRYSSDVLPKLKLSIEERKQKIQSEGFESEEVKSDEMLDNQFILGGARLPESLSFPFGVRLIMRGAFHELVELGLLTQDDLPLFISASPHWRLGQSHMIGQQSDLFVDVLRREIENRKILAETLSQQGTLDKVDHALQDYKEKLLIFWQAIREWPTYPDHIKKSTHIHEIDEEAVKEYIQNMASESTRETRAAQGLQLTPHENIIFITGGEIDHGFPHASRMPKTLEKMNEDSEKEIAAILKSVK